MVMTGILFPVVWTSSVFTLDASSGSCACGGVGDELRSLTGLAARCGLHASGDIDAPWADSGDGVGDVARMQSSGEQHSVTGRWRTFGERPVEDLAAARFGAVDHDGVGAEIGDPREGGMAGGERLDHCGNSGPDSTGILGGFVAVGGRRRPARWTISTTRSGSSAEDPDRHRFGREAANDVTRSVDSDLALRPRDEVQPDRRLPFRRREGRPPRS